MKRIIHIVFMVGISIFCSISVHSQQQVRILGQDTVKLIKTNSYATLYEVLETDTTVVTNSQNLSKESSMLKSAKIHEKGSGSKQQRNYVKIDSLVLENKIRYYKGAMLTDSISLHGKHAEKIKNKQ